MDLSLVTTRWQRRTVIATVVATALLFWTKAPDAFGLPKATLLWIGAIALVGLGVARAVWARSIRVPRSAWAIAVLVLVAAIAVTTLASDTMALSVVGEYTRYTGLLSYTAFAIAGLAVLRTFDVDESALLLRAVTAVLAVVGSYGLLQVLDIDPWTFGVEDVGAAGTMGNTNVFAGFLGIAVPAATWVALSATLERAWRLAAGAAAVLGFVVAVGTRSFQGPAAAVPGVALVIGAWLTTADGRAALARVRARIGGAAIPLVVLLALGGVGIAAVATLDGLRSGLVERGDFWRAGLSMFGDSPLLGSGFDTYSQHFLAERPEGHAIAFGATQAESAHSVPINLLAGGGLLVGLAWAAVIVLTGLALVRGLRRLDGEERLLLAGLGGAWLAYLVQSTVSFDVPTLGVLDLVLAGAIVAIGDPPAWIERRLPGRAPHATGRRGQQRFVAPTSTMVGVVVVGIVCVVGMWFATRPLRADLSAARAQDQIEDGNATGARASLVKATDLAPWQGRYWVLRAQLAEATQEVFEAATFAETAARRDPGSAQYALLAGRLNLRYRDAATAAPWFEAALERDPKNPDVWAALVPFARQSDPARAVELAEAYVALRPSPGADLVLADAYVAADDERGLEIIETQLRADPFGSDILALLLRYATEEPEVAVDLGALLTEVAPDTPASWFYAGEVHRLMGEVDEARELYERALDVDGAYDPATAAIKELDDAEAAGG